jgi:acetoin utilization protein AcuB
MIIEEIMKTNVITLSPIDTLGRAKLLMFENGIRHLPVVDEHSNVIGLVTRSDIYQNSLANGDNNRKVIQDIMNKNVITGHPSDFVEEVSAIFYENRIGCLPIIKGEKLVGIITETDMLHTFVQLTGAHQPGSQIDIRVPNKTGMLSDVASIMKEHNVNILSVLVYPWTDDSHKILVFRIQTMNPLSIIQNLKAQNYDVLWPRVIGGKDE